MNWLLISPSVDDENIKVIEDFLESKHNVVPFEVFLYSGLSKEDLYDNYRHIMQSTHCIIIDSYKMHELPDYNFVLGALAGKNIKTFVYTGDSYAKRYEILSSDTVSQCHCYNSVQDLIKAIDLDFEQYIMLDNQRQALIQLFTLGIPFTSDCFAQYIAKDDDEICHLFHDAGMLVNAKTTDGTPILCTATRNECTSKVKWLVENGADVNAVSADRGYSPVMDAVWRKNYELTAYLIENGADLDVISSDGQPILVLAVGNGNADIVKLLLDHGADPNIRDSMGMNAKDYARLFKNQAMLEIFEK